MRLQGRKAHKNRYSFSLKWPFYVGLDHLIGVSR